MDTSPDRHFVTELLRQWGSRDRQALDQLMPSFMTSFASRLLDTCEPNGPTTRLQPLLSFMRHTCAWLIWTWRWRIGFISSQFQRVSCVRFWWTMRGRTNGRNAVVGRPKSRWMRPIVVGPQASGSVLDLDEA